MQLPFAVRTNSHTPESLVLEVKAEADALALANGAAASFWYGLADAYYGVTALSQMRVPCTASYAQ